MTHEQVEELKKIQEEMELYDKGIRVFDIDHFILPSYVHGIREEWISEIKKPFRFVLRCFKNEGKNCVQLKPEGFQSTEMIPVDIEFVEMCLEYFKKKRAEVDKRFEEL